MMNTEVKQTFGNNKIWGKKRTSTERRLIILTGIAFFVALCMLVAIAIILHKTSANQDRQICTTPGCIHAASSALKYMDPSTDPCEDFYQFACGGFMKHTNIPEDKSTIGSFVSLAEVVRDQMKTMMDEPMDKKAPKHYHLLKKLYNMCMNTTAIEEDDTKTAKKMLKELGGWPLLEGAAWNEREFDWQRSVYNFRKLGFSDSLFITFYVGIDLKNSTRHVITLDQASLGMSREYLVKGMEDKYVKAYYDYMVDIAVLYGANRTEALKELKETLEFEIQIANITLPREKRRNSTELYHIMTIDELRYNYPSVPWLEYITKVLDIPDIEITEEEMVNVKVPKFITDILNLLEKTRKRTQANYVMRRAALSLVSSLTEAFRRRQFEYGKIFSGRTERQSRWKECLSMASGTINLASGAMYIRKHFNENSKKHAEEMIADIRAAFINILKEVDWMDDVTKKNALEKAATMTTHIGYPDELRDEKKIENFYMNLEFPTDNYLKNIKQITLFDIDYYNKQLRKPLNKTDWINHAYPAVVNAFYSSVENSIQFPAGILQGVFFSNDRPRYMNYGAIGTIMGHEITHGFDDQGRQFDKDGNLRDWWRENTKTAFLKKAQCIIDQYGNYTVTEIDANLNGINTQGENIADNGGVKEAYLAYQSWVDRNGLEARLPGLNYTPNQMFWISAVNVWCTKYRKEALKTQVALGAHSPSNFRILGPFSNSEYFSKDFQCPSGSKMNPVHKCKVW